MYNVAVITVSDKGSAGMREDTAGPLIVEIIENAGYKVVERSIIPDEKEKIKEALVCLSDKDIPLILTTGGTGFSKRDVTPEATLEICEKNVPEYGNNEGK
jgi:molybdenum cofactor synthesis domain-containing protein